MEEQTLNTALNPLAIRGSNQILRALVHPLRLQILQFIDGETESPVYKIFEGLGIEQSLASQHLRILRNAELVQTERNGKSVVYSVNYAKLKTVVGSCAELAAIKKKGMAMEL